MILPLWVYGVLLVSQLALGLLSQLLYGAGVPLDHVNPVTFSTILSIIVYGLATLVVIGVPWKLFSRRTTLKELGVPDLPAWMDIFLSVPAYVVYVVCSGIVMLVVTYAFSGIDLNQAQELPFSATMLVSQWQYVLAFLVMVVLAPFMEELLFRGYLYGKLRQVASVLATVVITSVAFGAAHLWVGPGSPLQWAVMIDTFTLSIMLCVLRGYTGAIWAGVIVHAIKNGLAFYLLFVNPGIVDQLKAALLPLF